MTRSKQPLCDAIIDPTELGLVADRIATEKQREVEIFCSHLLGDLDILEEIALVEKNFLACDFESAEKRLICVQAHIECLFPENTAGLACIFLCLSLVKRKQQLFYQAFGYLLHALSTLERNVGSLNVPATIMLNALAELEMDRGEDERAETARILARLVAARMRFAVPRSLTIWEYLRSQEFCVPRRCVHSPSLPLEECYREFGEAIRIHGMSSSEAAVASTRLGATLYSHGQLVEARRYLERGLSVSRHIRQVDIRTMADIYDLLVTICEQLDDPPASNQFRIRSRMLRMCASILPQVSPMH